MYIIQETGGIEDGDYSKELPFPPISSFISLDGLSFYSTFFTLRVGQIWIFDIRKIIQHFLHKCTRD